MVNKLLRITFVFGVVVLLILSVIPCQAISSTPTVLQVNYVNAYQNVYENGDTAFAVDFSAKYASMPTETIDTTYNVRLINSSNVEIRSIAPYPYFNNGYARGLVWFYFSAADTITYGLGTGWGGTYYIRLDGNPTASWTGSIPVSSPVTVGSWESTPVTTTTNKAVLSNYILTEANLITNDWASSSYKLTTVTSQNGTKLSSTGEAYFGAIINNLSSIAPYALLSSAQPLEIYNPTISVTATPANSIASDFTGSTYTTGTANFTYGSATVTGNATGWLSAMKGGQIKDNTDNVLYNIADVIPPGTLTLDKVYGNPGGNTHAYTMYYQYSALTLNLAAEALHVPTMIFGVVVCVAIMLFVVVHGCKEANSYKPAILIVLPLLYVFTRIGWFPMPLTVGLGIFAALGIWYVFFYAPSSA